MPPCWQTSCYGEAQHTGFFCLRINIDLAFVAIKEMHELVCEFRTKLKKREQRKKDMEIVWKMVPPPVDPFDSTKSHVFYVKLLREHIKMLYPIMPEWCSVELARWEQFILNILPRHITYHTPYYKNAFAMHVNRITNVVAGIDPLAPKETFDFVRGCAENIIKAQEHEMMSTEADPLDLVFSLKNSGLSSSGANADFFQSLSFSSALGEPAVTLKKQGNADKLNVKTTTEKAVTHLFSLEGQLEAERAKSDELSRHNELLLQRIAFLERQAAEASADNDALRAKYMEAHQLYKDHIALIEKISAEKEEQAKKKQSSQALRIRLEEDYKRDKQRERSKMYSGIVDQNISLHKKLEKIIPVLNELKQEVLSLQQEFHELQIQCKKLVEEMTETKSLEDLMNKITRGVGGSDTPTNQKPNAQHFREYYDAKYNEHKKTQKLERKKYQRKIKGLRSSGCSGATNDGPTSEDNGYDGSSDAGNGESKRQKPFSYYEEKYRKYEQAMAQQLGMQKAQDGSTDVGFYWEMDSDDNGSNQFKQSGFDHCNDKRNNGRKTKKPFSYYEAKYKAYEQDIAQELEKQKDEKSNDKVRISGKSEATEYAKNDGNTTNNIPGDQKHGGLKNPVNDADAATSRETESLRLLDEYIESTNMYYENSLTDAFCIP